MRLSPRRAVLLVGDVRAAGDERLGRILTFFGVPWTEVAVTRAGRDRAGVDDAGPYAVFASRHAWEAAHAQPAAADLQRGAVAAFVYEAGAVVRSGAAVADVSAQHDDFTGPMSGLRVTLDGAPVSVVQTPLPAGLSEPATIVAVGGEPALVRASANGTPVYICARDVDVDLDAPVTGNYYDVRAQFLSAVPLVMFITWAFRQVMWWPHELGACLIIDDPLLKHRYGFCNFPQIGELMRQHRFTTNIAFIPWNWRRTSSRGSDFFRGEAARFSVSIHGCDHTAAEFGTTSIERLAWSASTAQARMARHRERTRIEHEPVMVFPQGVFSSQCPDVLKRHGFMAAVNTEVAPVDRTETTVGDVWDVAILRYGAFPIYTRRYAFHGIENFAFDMLLGKPCFIVAHHDFFRDRGAQLVELVGQLASRGRALQWRSPGEVVRRAYRRRRDAAGVEQVEMYGSELQLENAGATGLTVHVSKRESSSDVVSAVNADGNSIPFASAGGRLTFDDRVSPGGTRLYTVRYKTPIRSERRPSLTYEMKVAARRLLSEVRDEYGRHLSR